MDERKETSLLDRTGKMIHDGDYVSLDGNMTADDSLGYLPNGWHFDETDIYQVYWDERIPNWSLRLNVEPDTPYNAKYMNHAVGLLHGEAVEVVSKPEPSVL